MRACEGYVKGKGGLLERGVGLFKEGENSLERGVAWLTR